MKIRFKSRGFTLIELLVSIVLMISITSMAIVAYSKISETAKEDQYSSIENEIITAAEQYLTKNSYILNDIQEAYTIIPLKTLVNNGLLKVLVDPTTKKKLDQCSYVEVIKNKGNLKISYNKNNTGKCNSTYITYDTSKYSEETSVLEYEELVYYDATVDSAGKISIGSNEVHVNGDKWFNIDSFSDDSEGITDPGTGAKKDRYLYVCAKFKDEGDTCSEGKSCKKVAESNKISFEGFEPIEKTVIKNKNLSCALYKNDFNKANRKLKVDNADNISVGAEFGKDTVAPEINIRNNCYLPSMGIIDYKKLFGTDYSDCNYIKIETNGLLSYISNNLPSNILHFSSEIKDNIEVDKDSIKSESVDSPIYKISEEEVGKKYIYEIDGADVRNELSFNANFSSSLNKYGYQIDLEAKDKAGNVSTNNSSVYGYVPCEDVNVVSANLITKTSFCIGKTKVTLKNDSLYDNGLWPTKFLCASNRSYTYENNNSTCTTIVNVTQTIFKIIKCGLIKFVDWLVQKFANSDALHDWAKNACPLGYDSEEETTVTGTKEIGTFGVMVSVYNKKTNKNIYSKEYSRSSFSGKINKNETINLNDQIGKKWLNGNDFPEGLRLEVILGGNIKSYSYSLSEGEGSRYNKKSGESGNDSKSNITYENPQKFSYYVTSDGKEREININVISEEDDNVSLKIIFNMDRTSPDISWTSNPEKAKNEKGCGTKGVAASFEVKDTTSGNDIIYYYYGTNNSEFDSTIQDKVSHVKGKGDTPTKYTDVWTSACSHSICSGGKCYNNAPSGNNYWHKVKAYDKAGNVAKRNSDKMK